MTYASLREFLRVLEQRGDLKRVPFIVDPDLEMTQLCQRSLREGGPALWFEAAKGSDMPVLGNLFGTTSRVAAALGHQDVAALRDVGAMLSRLKDPQWPDTVGAALERLPLFMPLLTAAPRVVQKPACHEVILEGPDVDLSK